MMRARVWLTPGQALRRNTGSHGNYTTLTSANDLFGLPRRFAPRSNRASMGRQIRQRRRRCCRHDVIRDSRAAPSCTETCLPFASNDSHFGDRIGPVRRARIAFREVAASIKSLALGGSSHLVATERLADPSSLRTNAGSTGPF